MKFWFLFLCIVKLSAVEIQRIPYGSWDSPISAEKVAGGEVRFNEIKLIEGDVYWLEERPAEEGRIALMRWSQANGEEELLPKEYSVRTRVHEYGCGAMLVDGSSIYFVRDQDQQIYQFCACGTILPVTDRPNCRFADGCAHPEEDRLYYVMEVHGDAVANSIVGIDASNGDMETIASGRDFYSNPRISPDGRQLAYVAWDHPNMPWDGTDLYVVDLETKQTTCIVAGGETESVVNPQWAPDGELYYISDRTGFWNLYRQGSPVWSVEADLAFPQWYFGESWVGFCEKGIFSTFSKKGTNEFATLDFTGKPTPVSLPYTYVSSLSSEKKQVAMIACSPTDPFSIVLYDFESGSTTVLKGSKKERVEEGYISRPRAIEFPTAGGLTAHAFYYPPCHPRYGGLCGEKPPLIVLSHGGPTAHNSPMFKMDYLYWTSRGVALLDVNYGGSSGYGRAYRERLNGQWGIVDVDDCVNGALYCAAKGLADGKRLAIEGGSAGGFTTLAALAFRNVFKAGADYFGVSDLERLTLDTHKFESRYLESLVAPYPERKDLFIERSPIHSVEKIQCPIIIFQGAEDAIVPPNQSESMYKSLCARGIPTAYFLYEGEQHGFRKSDNIRKSLEAELYFFSKVLGFPISDSIEPIAIDHLDEEVNK